jgi:hypothetical protein
MADNQVRRFRSTSRIDGEFLAASLDTAQDFLSCGEKKQQ